MPRILMCPPDHYAIEYEINPWMSRAVGAVRPLAARQWTTLRDTLQTLGAAVETIAPQAGLPDLVFTANGGLVYRDCFLSSSFRYAVRARESPLFDAWFAAHGFRVERLPAGLYHEGSGDALFCGDVLFAGYGQRSDAEAHAWVGRRFDIRVEPLNLVNPRFYHLDTCFCPLSPTEAIYFPEAFDAAGRRTLAAHVPTLLPVSEREAHRFGCNAVVVGRDVVHNSGCQALDESLRDLGYRPTELQLDEFLKAGGTAKCLTLRVDGEEAAGWKGGTIPG